MKCILDTKYSKADLKTIAERSTHLDTKEINELYTLLNNYESLFDGNLGIWHGKPYNIKLKPYAEPYHGTNFTCSTHIDLQERKELYTLVNKYESLFDGNIGTCHRKTYA